MKRVSEFVLMAWLSILLPAAAAALPQTTAATQPPTKPVGEQITEHEQNLAALRTAGNTRAEVMELNVLGGLYREAGKMQKALDSLNEALTLEKSEGNQPALALTEDIMGKVYMDLGEEDKALATLNKSLQIWTSLEIRAAEADTLNNIGSTYNYMGRRQEALESLHKAMQIWLDMGNLQGKTRMMNSRERLRDIGQWKALKEMNDALSPEMRQGAGLGGKANTMDLLGQTYAAMNEATEAFQYFNEALPIWQQMGEEAGEAMTLNNMGRAYADLGEKQEALEAFNKALALWKTTGARQGEALTLNNIGRLYRDLGEQQTALDYYNRGLLIWREVKGRMGEALALNDIGRAYADMRQPQKALEYSEQALPIWRETGARRGEAMTLNNMGRDYLELGEVDKALDFDQQALPIWREVKDPRGEALALMTIGWVQEVLQQPEEALASELAALSLARTAGDPEIEGGIETALMIGLRDQQHPEVAILFGLDAVNAFQQIGKNISGMEKDLRASFAQSKSMTYRVLAELLIEAGRLGEAEEILDLLKEQELEDTVRGVNPDAAPKVAEFQLSAAEQKALSAMDELEKMAAPYEQLSEEAAGLQTKTARTAEEDARLKELNAKMSEERAAVLANFKSTISPELEQRAGEAQAGSDNAAPSYLQNSLTKLGPRVLGIRVLLGENHVYVIVVTASSRKRIELKTSSAELRAKVFRTLKVLALRDADPRPELTELYGLIVAPIEDELKGLERTQGGAPTLLWSLDDALRYLPMAALYDGQQYMVERFNNVLFTPASYGHITDAPMANGLRPSVLAMGLSRSYGGLPALPGVLPELEAVVHDAAVPESHGPMEGRLLSNDKFTLAALKTELGAGQSVPVVHIASHFVVETGSGSEPYLMLGGEDATREDGYAWNLSEMENSKVSFHGTRLLTLSACSTAKDYTSRNGVEMDSLGMVAQQKDAEAVLATLWDVNDASTSLLMSDFYARWLKNPADGKAEALRQAQMALLKGSAASSGSGHARGLETEHEATATEATATRQDAGYALPYYWAPFVLIGNFK